MRKTVLQALVVLGLFLTLPWTMVSPPGTETNQPLVSETPFVLPATAMQADFNGTGWNLSGTSWDTIENEVVIDRPSVAWSAPPGAPQFPRMAACLFPIPERNELWLMGGIVDPSSQWNDEEESSLIEIYDVTNGTWSVSPSPLPNVQSHAGCARWGDTLVLAGDLPLPDGQSSVPSFTSGLVQRYNLTTDAWSVGTSMPGDRAVGKAGYAHHDGVLYVAGGVNRTGDAMAVNTSISYDIDADSWTYQSNLTTARVQPAAAHYRGKLYVMGGYTTTSTSVGGGPPQVTQTPTNTTEVMLSNGSWTNHTDLGVALAGAGAEVIHDEIVLFGGASSTGAQRRSYGWLPETDVWRSMGNLGRAVHTMAWTQYNNATFIVGGDSGNPSWGWMQIRSNVNRYVSPAEHTGTLVSPPIDLRTTTDGDALLRWIRLDGNAPSGTSLGLQYKTAPDPLLLNGIEWQPMIGNFSYNHPIGNHTVPEPPTSGSERSVEEFLDLYPWMQCRVVLSTTEGEAWTLPDMDAVSWGMEETVFTAIEREALQAYGQPLNLSTLIDVEDDWAQAVLVLDAGFGRTQRIVAEEIGGTWTLNSTVNDLRVVNVANSHVQHSQHDPHELAWNLHLDQGVVGLQDMQVHVEIKASDGALVFAAAPQNPTWTWSDGIDVHLDAIAADGRDLLSSSSVVVAGNRTLSVDLSTDFPGRNDAPADGLFQARIHLAVEGVPAGQLVPTATWFNTSTAWTDLDMAHPAPVTMVLPEDASGTADLRIELRTEANVTLNFEEDGTTFTLDAEAPALLGSSPSASSYTNQNGARNVILSFAEVGGFNPEDVAFHVWVEGKDDGQNGGSEDGMASLEEYLETPAMWTTTGTVWTANITVDDTANQDHQAVRVLVLGVDRAGLSVPSVLAESGHLNWTTRIPRTVDILSIAPNDGVQRNLEPGRAMDWQVEVSDGNGLGDLQEIRIELGGDPNLGLRWDVITEQCQNLDGRTAVVACSSSTNGDVMSFDLSLAPDWSLVPASLNEGAVRVVAKDIDGTNSSDVFGAWAFARDLTFDGVNLTDNEGATQGPVTGDSILAVGEHLNLTATIHHTASGVPYDGGVRLRWFGSVGPVRWDGGSSVLVQNGVLDTGIPAPLNGGRLMLARIEVWDPQDTVMLHHIDLDPMDVDESRPFLVAKSNDASWSRYHLDEVVVGINIQEDTAWNGPLNVTCQVTSTERTWPEVSKSVVPSGNFEGLTLFTAQFNFSNVGDPADLDPQASLSCWASGRDDAGRPLQGVTDLTASDPWFVATLTDVGPDLELGKVTLTGSVDSEGANVLVAAPVIARSEAIDRPFVVEITLETEGGETIVVRREVNGLGADESELIRGNFNVPKGAWTLRVSVDTLGAISELDEEDNFWTYEAETGGSGAGAWVAASGGLAVLGVGVVLLRRRTPSAEALEDVLPAQTPTSPKPKPKGPPGADRRVAGGPKAPPRTPTKTVVDLASAEAALAALTPAEPAAESAGNVPEIGTIAKDHTELPGGGDYDYTAEATTYHGEGLGRWQLRDDGSFERVA